MKAIRVVLVLAAAISMQPVLANMMNESKACGVIAKACEDGGYADKAFWQDCMKPILLGKTVAKTKVDLSDVKSCRVDKIESLKKELQELQDAASRTS